MGDSERSNFYVLAMQKAIKDCLAATDDTYDTGRAGTLMAAAMINNYFGATTILRQDIVTMAYQILDDGIKNGKNGQLVWPNSVYPNIIFNGEGHGSTGVINQLLDIPEILSNQTAVSYIKNTLNFYLTIQYPDGNFPTPLIPPYPTEPDVLVQWCHGAPGFMPILTKAYYVLGDPRYLAAADKASDCTWQRGLLTKGLMLCHGVSGNTYMFLYMYEKTQNPKYLYRAIKFQEYTLSQPIMVDPNQMRIPSPSPYMFWAGSYASAVPLWSDMANAQSNSKFNMPGFAPYP
jgi:lantibiotic modifying enzyme